MLKIDESNYNYLVRPETSKYNVSVSFGVPRRTVKGNVGYKCKSIEKDLFTREEAEKEFYNWKEEYLPKYIKKEITYLRILLYPVTYHYVTCPKCGKDAEINTMFMHIELGEGTENAEFTTIFCRHCADSNDLFDQMDNVVGKCYMNMFRRENELNFYIEYPTAGVRFEDWLK